MSENLLKRVFTSFFLITVLYISMLNEYLWLFLIITVSILCFFEFIYLTNIIWKNKKFKINVINLIGLFYLVILICSSYLLYNSGSKLDVYYILFVCIFSDTGGYVFGKFFGGIKLTKISPKKTISGAIGSFLFSSFTLFIFFYTSDLLLNAKYTFTYIVIITLFLSFISQVGDLIISIFKRKAKVKDTGSILPGHGGLLDRVDGMIFAIPVYMIVITLPYQL